MPYTFYVGTLKAVGRVCQQTFIDTYAKVGRKMLMQNFELFGLSQWINNLTL